MINITAKLSEAPLGFEYTGEFRSVRENEYFTDNEYPGKLLFWESNVPSFGDHWILRKKKMGTEELRQRLEEVEKQVYALRSELTQIKENENTSRIDCGYHKIEPKPPKGFKFTGEFRVPLPKEYFVDNEIDTKAIGPLKDTWTSGKRKILQKLKRFVFEETGEVRQASFGEFFLELNGKTVSQWKQLGYPTNPVSILRLVEENADTES